MHLYLGCVPVFVATDVALLLVLLATAAARQVHTHCTPTHPLSPKRVVRAGLTHSPFLPRKLAVVLFSDFLRLLHGIAWAWPCTKI